jgi:hypothetical protein
MLARDEQNVAETLLLQFPRLAQNFVNGKRHAQNRIVAREAAVGTIVDALVGNVKRREQADDFAETLLRQLLRTARECFKQFGRRR